ncbi:conserved Plasmodium protein, unknown function [Plasmodium ovale wallikeri]|uniref:Uncharacterized protein n=2 Tax=Plasmodium ovale TaxID=36330 RepID=A0A1C3KUW8_PLAOA|nr:conserved Plasmodium protein, unknown function [Plasmodium ovale wallikeri]SBT77974.1 conserved Plasmodium protein, unknown function [Plasmodium ovale]
MNNPDGQRKGGVGLGRSAEEERKIKANQNEAKFRKFCGSTEFMLDVPNIDESLKFLKHEVDKSILNFSYNTMFLNEKIERLNDAERNVYIPMELPFMYSFNVQKNRDMKEWICTQNTCEKERNFNVVNNNIYVNDKMKEFFPSYLPLVKSFERDDFTLLNCTIPNYFKSVKNSVLANKEKEDEFSEQNKIKSGEFNSNSFVRGMSSKKYHGKMSYNYYFQHPLKKNEKIKKIYPILPYISIWKNKYVQGIMEIESSNDNVRGKGTDNCKSSLTTTHSATSTRKNKALYGLLHLIEKSRDKHLYSLYRKHEINMHKFQSKNVQSKEHSQNGKTFDDKEGDNICSKHAKERQGKHKVIRDDMDNHKLEIPMHDGHSHCTKQKKKISLSKFLIKKHILKLKNIERGESKLSETPTGLCKTGAEGYTEEIASHRQMGKMCNNETNDERGENRNEVLHEDVQCFKYVRDYKSPSFTISEKDPVSYVLSFSKKKKLAFIFPTISKKIIFSKTGQQKRKNYIILKEFPR